MLRAPDRWWDPRSSTTPDHRYSTRTVPNVPRWSLATRGSTVDRMRRLGGRYCLEQPLGQGGMAEVWLARDLLLFRPVAVKTLRPELAADAEHWARFRREAVSTALLGHPSIVSVYDTGEEMADGAALPYLVMEYVKGTTLLQLVREERIIGPEHALELTLGVLEALEHAHFHGIVHRDIKPANAMLSHEGTVKVMDFGIARSLDPTGKTLTRTSVVLGTAEYLSPEQARGEVVDCRTDLYSTGCLLFELLTGRPPFTGDTPLAVAMKHVAEPTVPPSAYVSGLPSAYDALVLRALAKDRADRYQTAEEMRHAIGEVLAGRASGATSSAPARSPIEPGTPLLPHRGPRKRRSVRRRRVRRALRATAVLLVTLAGVAAYLITGRPPTSPDARVAAPSLIGKTMTQARSSAQAAGVRLQRMRHRACPQAAPPAGRVCEQTPSPGSRMASHTVVRVTVSLGPSQ
ncbi:protein kinase domain-containing protein [Streptomyces griseorubiginosus]|uniref:protein kinase domain-containing protein n=1 Tax=Streptomyces griseorubiginosus TaxID=67304 RepID=UPI0036ED2946